MEIYFENIFRTKYHLFNTQPSLSSRDYIISVAQVFSIQSYHPLKRNVKIFTNKIHLQKLVRHLSNNALYAILIIISYFIMCQNIEVKTR